MNNLDNSVGILIINKDIATNSIELLPKKTCSEYFLGRCKKLVGSEVQFCKSCQECKTPHEIVYINKIKEK